MNINQKIEQIRRQPEHIRLRWVWGMVAVSMFFVFMLWLFSLQVMFKKDSQNENTVPSLDETLSKIKESAPSLKDMPLTTTPATNEGVSAADGFQQQLNPDLESNINQPIN